jgi:hypothetical protein
MGEKLFLLLISSTEPIMNNTLSICDNPLLSRHRDNIMASLTQRLQRARNANDLQLVQLLEQEKQQIEQEVTQLEAASRSPWLSSIQHWLNSILFGNAELQVSQFVDGDSDEWWYAFDPQTGRCVYADSEAELRLWIKNNYQGR